MAERDFAWVMEAKPKEEVKPLSRAKVSLKAERG